MATPELACLGSSGADPGLEKFFLTLRRNNTVGTQGQYANSASYQAILIQRSINIVCQLGKTFISKYPSFDNERVLTIPTHPRSSPGFQRLQKHMDIYAMNFVRATAALQGTSTVVWVPVGGSFTALTPTLFHQFGPPPPHVVQVSYI